MAGAWCSIGLTSNDELMFIKIITEFSSNWNLWHFSQIWRVRGSHRTIRMVSGVTEIYIYKLFAFVSARKALLSKNYRRTRISFRFFKKSYVRTDSQPRHALRKGVKCTLKFTWRIELVYELFYFQFEHNAYDFYCSSHPHPQPNASVFVHRNILTW